MIKSAHPKFKSDLLSLDLSDDVNSRLSQHLNRIYIGYDNVIYTPIAKANNPGVILRKLDDVFKANESKLNKTLLDLENSNRAKFGPRSISVPWSERKGTLVSSFEPDNSDVNTSSLKSKLNLRPLTLESALKLLKNNTNSGLPFYARKGRVKERIIKDFDHLLNKKYPCILFTRTQEQSKTRNVWGFPIADTLNEMRYYAPLLSYRRKLQHRSALVSPEQVSRSLTELILRAVKLKDHKLISIDFAAFDASVKSKLQKYCFEYIKSLFQPSFHSGLDYIEERFNTIGILTPDGIMSGPHGVPSGSTFTNEVDSIAQELVVAHLNLNNQDYQVQGDDGVYLIHEREYPKLIKSFEDSGLVVSKDKSYVSNNYAIYLQNLYHMDYYKNGLIGGIYPIYRALNRILFQERWSTFEDYGISGRDYYAIRTICIVENCKYHPLFREFVKFIYDLDKYSLDPSDQGIASYVQMVSSTKGAGEILKHQYGDDVSGIKSFETYKMIKELG